MSCPRRATTRKPSPMADRMVRVVMTETVTYEHEYTETVLSALGVKVDALLADPGSNSDDWLLEDILNHFDGVTEREWNVEEINQFDGGPLVPGYTSPAAQLIQSVTRGKPSIEAVEG